MWLRRLGQMLLRRLGQRPLRRLGQVDHRFLSPVTVDNHPRLAALLLSHRTAPDVYGFGFTRGSRARSMLFSVQRGLCHPVGITRYSSEFCLWLAENILQTVLWLAENILQTVQVAPGRFWMGRARARNSARKISGANGRARSGAPAAAAE
jgi:hypothetical protein